MPQLLASLLHHEFILDCFLTSRKSAQAPDKDRGAWQLLEGDGLLASCVCAMRRKGTLPTPCAARSDKKVKEPSTPIDGERLEALRREAKRQVAATRAMAGGEREGARGGDAREAPGLAPLALSCVALVALCVGASYARSALLEDLARARSRLPGECSVFGESEAPGYVWVALSLPDEGTNGWRPIVASAAVVAKRLGASGGVIWRLKTSTLRARREVGPIQAFGPLQATDSSCRASGTRSSRAP